MVRRRFLVVVSVAAILACSRVEAAPPFPVWVGLGVFVALVEAYSLGPVPSGVAPSDILRIDNRDGEIVFNRCSSAAGCWRFLTFAPTDVERLTTRLRQDPQVEFNGQETAVITGLAVGMGVIVGVTLSAGFGAGRRSMAIAAVASTLVSGWLIFKGTRAVRAHYVSNNAAEIIDLLHVALIHQIQPGESRVFSQLPRGFWDIVSGNKTSYESHYR